jgi:hypothetical protein
LFENRRLLRYAGKERPLRSQRHRERNIAVLKKSLDSGVLYFAIGLLFILGAVFKSISNNSIVLAIQWFCAMVFIILGALQFRKNIIH